MIVVSIFIIGRAVIYLVLALQDTTLNALPCPLLPCCFYAYCSYNLGSHNLHPIDGEMAVLLDEAMPNVPQSEPQSKRRASGSEAHIFNHHEVIS